MASSHSDGAAISRADWMASLPPHLHDVPLNKMCIPGSHNSASFWLDCDIPPSPACPAAITTLCTLFGPGARQIVRNWAVCQTLTWSQQLDAGIRYFDLRLSSKPDSSDIFYEHSLYGSNITQSLQDILRFLEGHPKEVVLLDFRSFAAMSDEAHEILLAILISSLGSMLYPRGDLQGLTLSKLWEANKRLLVFYHHASALKCTDIWPGSIMPAPWADSDNPDGVLAFVDNACNAGLPSNTFHVAQCIITPTAATIMSNKGSLKNHVGSNMSPKVCEWLKSKSRSKNQLNICTTDFVEDGGFIDLVIGLNN